MNKDICPHCGSPKSQGTSAPMSSLSVECHIEQLVMCLDCQREYVSTYSFVKNIPISESSRFEEDSVFDAEALACQILDDMCEEWGIHLTFANWVVFDEDVVVGFVAKPLPMSNNSLCKVMFFNSIGIEGAYYSSDLLSECAQWAIPHINQLLIDNDLTVITQDDRGKLYCSLLVKKEK